MFSCLSLILDISSQIPAVPVIAVLLLAAEFVMIHKDRLPWLLPLLSVAVFAISSLVYLAGGFTRDTRCGSIPVVSSCWETS